MRCRFRPTVRTFTPVASPTPLSDSRGSRMSCRTMSRSCSSRPFIPVDVITRAIVRRERVATELSHRADSGSHQGCTARKCLLCDDPASECVQKSQTFGLNWLEPVLFTLSLSSRNRQVLFANEPGNSGPDRAPRANSLLPRFRTRCLRRRVYRPSGRRAFQSRAPLRAHLALQSGAPRRDGRRCEDRATAPA